ncbi:hypothetical protein RB653_004241 [Dictyostelium firmibasis]|uniref:Uncharacterized protein n=1 Tax=Dictyostelium firmibasis TaxID=79012 RepID=A0AAN7U712_9MYCE
MSKIKSIKIFKVEDVGGEKTELVWVNGQLVDSSSKVYLLKLSNPIRGNDTKKIQINDASSTVISQAKEIFREYVKKVTNNGKIKLKNFQCGDCDCEICLNEPPVIIKDKKEIPRTASTWIDYVRISLFCINKQHKLRNDSKEQQCREKIENKNKDNEDNDNVCGGHFENGKDYFVSAKDLFDFMRAHKGLLELEKAFETYQPREIRQCISQSMHYNPNLFKSGKDYLGAGFWTLVDVDDDPWYDIDIPDDIPTQRMVNGKLMSMCLAQTQKGYCQKVGVCPHHQKWNKSMATSDSESDDDNNNSNNKNKFKGKSNNTKKNENKQEKKEIEKGGENEKKVNKRQECEEYEIEEYENDHTPNKKQITVRNKKIKDKNDIELISEKGFSQLKLIEKKKEGENEDKMCEEDEYEEVEEEEKEEEYQQYEQEEEEEEEEKENDEYVEGEYYEPNDYGEYQDDQAIQIYNIDNDDDEDEEFEYEEKVEDIGDGELIDDFYYYNSDYGDYNDDNSFNFDMESLGRKCKNLEPYKLEREIMKSFSFTSILNRMLIDSEGQIPTEIPKELQLLPREYTRFMILKFLDNDMKVDDIKYVSLQAPTLITEFWHYHIVHTEKYREFCRLLKTKIHCYPNINFEPLPFQRKRYERTLELYREHFIRDKKNYDSIFTFTKKSKKKTIGVNDDHQNSKINFLPPHIWPLDLFTSNENSEIVSI